VSADDDYDQGTRREDSGADENGLTRREPKPGDPGRDRGTRREDADGGTRREDRSRAPGGTPGPSGFTRGLPPELAARFSVAEELAAGAEADVVLADEVSSGRRLVLKLYRRNVVPDEGAVERLAAADHAHVVDIADWGWAGGCWYEVLEYCRFGSLRTLLTDGPAPAVMDAVRETAPALAHIHQLNIVHRDLKPENILIRELRPLDVVLGDFGIARALDASVRWTREWGTPAYSPPEFEGGEVSAAWDWWSLGMIIAELAGGRHPFELAGGLMMNNQQIRSALAQRAVDLSAVSDDRIRLLCHGLLTRDRTHRWGYREVTEWLAGRSPRVIAERTVGTSRSRTVFFAGQNHTTVEGLAAALQQHWDQGIRQVYTERDATLTDEISRLLRQYEFDEAARLLAPGGRADEQPRRYAALLAELDPGLSPVYNGVDLTERGLEAAALEILAAGSGHPAAPVLDEVRRLGILVSWRDLPGMGAGGAIQQRWTAANTELEKRITELRGSGYSPDSDDWARARARLLLVALSPDDHGAQLAAQVAGGDTRDAEQQRWWRQLRDAAPPTPAAQTLAWLTRDHAARQTSSAREAERTRREAEQRRQTEAEQARRRQQREARRRGLVGRWRVDRNWAILTVLVIASYLVPHALGTALEKWWSEGVLPTWWTSHQTKITVAPPPNLAALPSGANFVPQWIFGGLVILIVLAVILLRPPWNGRWPQLLIALALAVTAFFAPSLANKAVNAYNKDGQAAYNNGPISLKAFDHTCNSYWTTDEPVSGTAYMRWVLAGSASDGSSCGELAAFVGWRAKWQRQLNTSDASWASLYMYGNVLVAEEDPSGQPNVLDGFDKMTGRELWVFSCDDGDDSYVANTTYRPTAITVTCERGQVTVNPQTGRQG